ncbi:MAG: hypothetical protein ACO36I_07580 [Candidatus Latescibacterota bacterium]|jgi:hypothetical protein
MTVTLNLQLSPESEEALRLGIVKKDPERVRELLLNALEPAVEALLRQGDVISGEEFEIVADELANVCAEAIDLDAPVYSDQTFNRATIYADHL